MKHSKSVPYMVSVSAAVSALLHANATVAQQSSESSTLEEITVTATRRAESVTDVPYNITAITADDLMRSGVTDLDALGRSIAGLANIDQGPRAAGNNSQFILRGLNANAARALDDNHRSVAPVSTYLGETPIFFNLKLFDIERVEVLRGPQGTLYGSGSLGGTVRFIPNRPEFEEFSGQAQVEVASTKNGSGANRDLMALLNIPLGTNLALRVGGGHQHLGGFITQTNLAVLDSGGKPQITGPILDPDTQVVRRTERDTNDSDMEYARAALAANLGSEVRAELHYNYQHTSVGDRQADNPYFPGSRAYEASNALRSPQTAHTEVLGLDVEAQLGFATLTSATSWYETQVDAIASDSGVYQLFLADAYYFSYPRFVVQGPTRTQEKSVAQEIRLTSKGDQTLEWLAGAFYRQQDKKYSLVQPSDQGLVDYVTALDPFQSMYGVPTPSIAGLNLFDQGFSEEFRDTAVFGELTWHVTDRWQITGGARRFWQKDDSSQSFALPVCQQLTFCGPPVRLTNSTSEGSQIFRANSSFELDDSNNLYFTWAQGFRHGGANAVPPPGTPQSDASAPAAFRSDRSTNWELGLKGVLHDLSLRYSLAAFYVEWKDFQFDAFTAFSFSFVGNGSQASSKGAEVEITGELSDQLSYSASYSYVDAKVDKTFSTVTTAKPGDPLPGVPRNSASLGLNYEHTLVDGLTLTYHIDGSYRDTAYSDFNAGALSFFQIEALTAWNAAITLSSDSRWNVRLFAQNLFSEKGRTGGSTPGRLGDEAYFQVMRPLTVGVRVTANF